MKAQVPVDETDVSYGVGILVLGEQPGALVKLRSFTLDLVYEC